MNIDDKKSLQMLTYHSFETTGNMHNVHIYKKKKKNFNRLSLFSKILTLCKHTVLSIT